MIRGRCRGEQCARVLALESRVLFEAAPPFIDPAGVLRISATEASALVRVVRISDPAQIKVQISVGLQLIETYYFARSEISSVDIVTGDSRDEVNLLGNEENDEAPLDLRTVINTGGGTDVVFCGVGTQTIDTGNGDDAVLYNGRTDVDLGPGNDEVVFIRLWDGGTIDLGSGNDFVRTDESGDVDSVPVTILGGEGDDTIDLHEFGEFNWFRFSGGPGIDTIDCELWQRRNLNLSDYPETENVINFGHGVLTGNELDNY